MQSLYPAADLPGMDKEPLHSIRALPFLTVIAEDDFCHFSAAGIAMSEISAFNMTVAHSAIKNMTFFILKNFRSIIFSYHNLT